MDIVAPLAKTGVISEALNLWLAVPIGFVFGFGLYHAGFTDSRKIASAFYLKDVGVPVVMFSAIVTGMLGLWILSLSGFIDTSKMYYLPTYLTPMAVGGLLFGIGMAIGGFCPGTAAASIATGRIDAVVFVVGFLGGSILFGDLFPVWGDFYKSDYHGVYRLDELFGVNLGLAVFIIVVAAVAGSLLMRRGQHLFWSTPRDQTMQPEQVLKYEAPLVGVALLVGFGLAFVPTGYFLGESGEAAYYIIPKQQGLGPVRKRQHGPAVVVPPVTVPAETGLPAKGDEGC